MDYPVADFGLDQDIVGTHKSLDWSQGDIEHDWNLDTADKDFKWADLPHVDAEFKLVQLKTLDDPICNSAGCT